MSGLYFSEAAHLYCLLSSLWRSKSDCFFICFFLASLPRKPQDFRSRFGLFFFSFWKLEKAILFDVLGNRNWTFCKKRPESIRFFPLHGLFTASHGGRRKKSDICPSSPPPPPGPFPISNCCFADMVREKKKELRGVGGGDFTERYECKWNWVNRGNE